jgi:hypothetical protein
MKNDKKRIEAIELILNYFMITPAEELLNMPLKEFKVMIQTLPSTDLYNSMCISLMDDFIKFEDYEKCSILRDHLNKVSV